MHLKRFKQYRLEEAKITIDATKMEKMITIAYNGGYKNSKNKYKIKEKKYNVVKDIAENIAEDIKKHIKSSDEMIHYGNRDGKLNPNWKGNAKSKTDIYNNDANISLKQKGGSQIISSLKNETISIFYAACEYMSKHDREEIMNLVDDHLVDVLKTIKVPGDVNTFTQHVDFKNNRIFINTVESMLENLLNTKTTLNVELPIEVYNNMLKMFQKFKKYKTDIGETSLKYHNMFLSKKNKIFKREILREILDYIKNQLVDVPENISAKTKLEKEINYRVNKDKYEKKQSEIVEWKKAMKDAQIIFTNYFEENEKFKKWFVYEAATGETKFAPDDHAKANWMIEFDSKEGYHNNINLLSKGIAKPSEYVKKLASEVTIRISPKTASGNVVDSTGKGSTFGAFRVDQKTEKIKKESLETFILEEFDAFSSQLLNEGFFSDSYEKVKNWLSETYTKIVTKLKELVKSGLSALMKFFNYDVEEVEIEGLEIFGFA